MMTTELSKRLRNICDRCCNVGNLPLIPIDELRSYADIIDQQAAEIARLRKKLVVKLDDYYGTPCEQIRHKQEIDELAELVEAQKQEILDLHDVRDQRDEWRRRAERLLVLATKWTYTTHHDWREITGAAQWFEED